MKEELGFIGAILVILFFICIVCVIPVARVNSTENIQITVKSKERIAEDGDGKYLIFTENEVFENTDELLKFKFNSSDVYSQFEVGKTYTCEVIGWRVPFFSWYRNIIKCW